MRHNEQVSSIRTEMEKKYGHSLIEVRRAAALLEIQVETEKQRVEGYKKAMQSHRLQMMDEKKHLKQVNNVSSFSKVSLSQTVNDLCL